MTSAVLGSTALWPARAEPVTKPAPPRRHRAPVFLQDAVTPWAGETMLLTLLRAQAIDAQSDEDQP